MNKNLLAMLIVPAIASAAALPAGGQGPPDSGSYFEPVGDWETRPPGEPDSSRPATSVVPAAWDQSSWLIDRDQAGTANEDRPGVVRRLFNTARGRVLIEGGYAYVTDSAGPYRASEHVVPDLLLRVGVTERLEVRVGWPGVSIIDERGPLGDSSDTRALDPNVGLMWDLFAQDGWVPQAAVLASLPITLAGERFSMNSIQPLSGLLYQWRLTDALTLGGESSVAFFRDQGDHYLQWQQAADLDYLLTERVGVFAQWQMLADDGSAQDLTRQMLSGGLSWLCTDRLQITWRIGAGLNDAAPDLLTDIRFGYLF